jgi:hypothetical protein
LRKAKSEIDQLAHFRVEWREIRQGRTVTELEFRFEPKGAPEVIETVDELDRHSAGRQARREGAVESISVGQGAIRAPRKAVARSKPQRSPFQGARCAYGEHESEFLSIGRQYGGGWDVDMIADGFRAQYG